ncbi:uncharacterized protein METZ01_LOCUS208440 [marine metagenome]|uniref:2-phospho-L-lactate guanylyltransferase n=1 Tax=marine metagenome TaxID=408172 RepID=A0A382EXW7_9ZZZZ
MTRLSMILDLNKRIKLTKMMADQMINYLTNIPEIEKIVLLTNESTWVKTYHNNKIIHREDKTSMDLKENINQTAEWLDQQGVKQMLYVSVDLPFALKDDLMELINQHTKGLTIVEAKKDGGTNALIIDLSYSMKFQFGKNSFERHIRKAKSLGIQTTEVQIEGLSFDLDNIDDWKDLIDKNNESHLALDQFHGIKK